MSDSEHAGPDGRRPAGRDRRPGRAAQAGPRRGRAGHRAPAHAPTRPEEFAELARGPAAADLFTVTVGEEYGGMGMGDVEAAIVLEEIARVDVSSAILCQLVFNGPPRAIEHLGNDGLRARGCPRRPPGSASHRHHRARRRLRRPPCGPTRPRRRGLAPRRLQELRHRSAQGRGVPGVVPLPGQRAGRARASAPSSSTGRDGVSWPGPTRWGPRGHRGRARLRRRAGRPDDVLVPGDPADNTSAFKTLLAHINHERCGNAAMCVGAAQGALEYAVPT